MALILSSAERDIYCPTVILTDGALDIALTLAQSEAETLAGRPLSRTAVQEDWDVPPTGSFYLAMHPVDISTLEIRTQRIPEVYLAAYGHHTNPRWEYQMGASSYDQDWDLVEPGEVEVEPSGLVRILNLRLRKLRFTFDSEPDQALVKSSIAAILLYHHG